MAPDDGAPLRLVFAELAEGHHAGAEVGRLDAAFALALRQSTGVHYASDVLAGALSGGAWLAVCIAAVEWHRRWRGARPGR